MFPFRLSRRAGHAGGHHGHAAVVRRSIAPLAVLAASALLLTPSLASADSSTTLTVVGPTDISDSGLIPTVIQPAFKAAFPQFSFKYIGTSPGSAIALAENGIGGASVLIDHSEPLENAFVSQGYSYEPFGRALWSDGYQLEGPPNDPAGVHTNATNNIAVSFADVAAAGIGGNAEFISRGGTSGNTIEEHQIWALLVAGNLEPPGLDLCAVNAASGGGDTPISPSKNIANGQPCPNGGAVPSGSALPSWYVSTGLSQGPNVVFANTCAGYHGGPNSCYVFTDAGTYDYLTSGTAPAGTVTNLATLSSDNLAAAPGGQYALVNYFHAYVLNPAKVPYVNLPAAEDFVNFITSRAIQAQVAAYLSSSAAGAPYTADAAPLITTKPLPTHVTADHRVVITGTVANAEPGYPVVGGVKVTVSHVSGTVSVPVATARTNATGAFTLSFAPTVSGGYTLSTPQFSQIEDPNTAPPFGDTLAPALTTPTRIVVRGVVSHLRARSRDGGAVVIGSVAPTTGHVNGRITVSARLLGTTAYRTVDTSRLSAKDGRFAAHVALGAGHWQLKVVFSDKGTIATSRARTTTVTVAGAPPVRMPVTRRK